MGGDARSNWRTVRVFISSTFLDMQAERDWLVRFVFPNLREELVKYRIHFVDVDLRWGVTGEQDALSVCREVIDECHPRFMCMLGGRYGWVPEERERSITADEVHYTVLDREAEKRGRAFFYFREDAATAGIVEATCGDFREPAGSANAQKLAGLKREITDAGLPVFTYAAQWDAAHKRLTGLESFGNQVHTDLLQSLRDDPELAIRFTGNADVPFDEFAEEAEQMEVFIQERTEHHVIGSREPLLQQMLAFATGDGTPNLFVLTGGPGSGKSALLAKLCRSLSPSPSLFLPHFIGASTGSTDLRRTLRRLCHEIAEAAGNTELLPLDIKDLITHFQKLLAEAADNRRVILVFDALNQFDAADGAHWLNWLPRELPPDVRIVASVIAPADGQPEHQTLAILRARPGTRMEKLEPLTEADTLAVIEGYLRRYAKRLSPEQLAALLAKPAGRLPLYVLTALEELRTLGTYDEITARIRELPGDARALFGWILTERLARDPGFRDREGRPCGAALVEKFAACLGVSRHGLSPPELTALLDPGDPLGNVAALLRLLRPYLMRRGELLDFFHGQFREAAEAAYLDASERQRAAHLSVASCLQAFADPHCDGQCRDATLHALSELPHHQTHAEAWPDLIATLENIFFLEIKVTHGMAFDLALDFSAAVDAMPPEHAEQQRLRLLNEALRRDLHFIDRHAKDYPQALFQSLWSTAWWYDSEEAIHHYVVPEGGWKEAPPWETPDEAGKLSTLLERWHTERWAAPNFGPWLRSLRPPSVHLGAGQLAVLRGRESEIYSVAFSHDGHRIVSGSVEIRLWDAQSGRELAVLRGHESSVDSVAFSHDDRRVLSGSWDKTVRLWDAYSGRELAILRGHEDYLRSVVFSPDGSRVASGSNDKTVRLWDAHSARELAVLRGHEGMVTSVAFSPDGRGVLSGSADTTIRLWDAHTGRKLAVLRGHENQVRSVAFSPDGRRVLSGSADMTVRLWDARRGREMLVLHGHDGMVNSVAFSPDGGRVLVSGSGDRSGGGLLLREPHDYTVRLWDAQSGRELAALRGHEKCVTSVAFSPDGRRVLSGSWDGTMRLWDARCKRSVAVPRGHEHSVDSVVFSPDGHRIHSVSGEKVRLWDADNGREVAVLRGHDRDVTIVALSPDGRRVLTGSMDCTVRLWDAHSGQGLAVFRGHEGCITSVTLSPDGRRVLSGSWDRTARLWDAEDGREVAVLQGQDLHGYAGVVTSVAFSPDGRRVLCGSGGLPEDFAYERFPTPDDFNAIRLWDAESGQELAVLRGHRDKVTAVAFSPDCRKVISGSNDRTVRVWDTQGGECLKVLQGSGDITAIAMGVVASPWRAFAENGETIIEPASGDLPVAWFPLDKLYHITTHPKGRSWAGVRGSHLFLLRLEGG